MPNKDGGFYSQYHRHVFQVCTFILLICSTGAISRTHISLLFLVLFGKILHGMNVKTKNETVFIADLDIYEI